MVKMHYDGVMKKIEIYSVVDIGLDGMKSCLGLHVAETESAKHWLIVMDKFKNQGVQDMLGSLSAQLCKLKAP